MLEASKDAQYLILACGRCGTRNRIEESRIYDHPVCGKCRHSLSDMPRSTGRVTTIDDQAFDMVMSSVDEPVVVNCWAPWCGSCRKIAPLLETLAARYVRRVTIMRLDADKNPQTIKKFRVRTLPALLFFKKGRLVKTMTRNVSIEEIERQMLAIL